MVVNEKTIAFRMKPYTQEVVLQAGIDIIVIVLIASVLLLVKFPPIACIAAALGYLVIAVFAHYRVIMQALADKRKGDLITETVSVKQFSEEYSLAGDRLGHSYICHFYPKEMQVQKYRVKVVNNDGEEKKLRAVMSCRRLLQFSILGKQQIETLQVTYLKRSKILLCVELTQEMDKDTRKRKKEEIEKAIRFINTSI